MAVLTHVQAPTVARRFASRWKRPALLVMAALAAGMAASLLFVWPYGGAGAEPTFAWHTRERPARHEVVQLVRAGVVATVFYLVAAGAEWFELWLVVRGGNPA